MPTPARMQAIMVDAELGRPAKGYTEEELTFRRDIERELATARERGLIMDIPFDLPWAPVSVC